MAESIEIVEVGPRDGLQNEAAPLTTEAKVEFIERSIAAGIRRIEATSFVNPKAVPAMADAADVMAAVPRSPDVVYSVLVLNDRGVDRALEAAADEINFVVVATDTFSLRNQNATTAEALDTWARIAETARTEGLRVGVTIGAAFGCPFEGEVSEDHLADIVRRVADAGPDEISLADTIGVAVPIDITRRFALVDDIAPDVPARVHLHDTRNTAIANMLAAVDAGVRAIDASTGGIGGCPFAPRATGNVATEDVVYALDRTGIATGLDLGTLIDNAAWLGGRLGASTPGMVSRAGPFPSGHVA